MRGICWGKKLALLTSADVHIGSCPWNLCYNGRMEKKCLVEGCPRLVYKRSHCRAHAEQIDRRGYITSKVIRKHGHLELGDREKIISMLKETELTCEEIGSVFDVSRGPVHKIQQECKIKRKVSRCGDNIFRKCETCNKVFRSRNVKSRPNREKYCSKQCYTVWQKSEANKGPNNPAYIDGGSESEMNQLRKTDEWKGWRTSVYERDDYTCVLCGQKGGRLHPHHIKKKSLYPELVFDVTNGVTLCEECHHLKDVHVDGGKFENRFMEASMFHLR